MYLIFSIITCIGQRLVYIINPFCQPFLYVLQDVEAYLPQAAWHRRNMLSMTIDGEAELTQVLCGWRTGLALLTVNPRCST